MPPRTALERELTALDPANVSGESSGAEYASYAAALIRAGQLTQAADALAAGFAVEPQNLELRIQEARLLHARGESEAALTSLDRLLMLTEELRRERASDFASRGITSSPDRPEAGIVVAATLLKAEIYSDADRPNEAIAAFELALAQDPTMSDVLVSRGNLYLEIGMVDDARSDFEAALGFVPDLESALAGLAEIEGTPK